MLRAVGSLTIAQRCWINPVKALARESSCFRPWRHKMSTEQGLKNSQFELRGVNHLALVCSNRERTIDFYSKVLGMPLVGDIELPGGAGHHFFFDIGKGDLLAFFSFRDAPSAAPGIAS